MSQIQPTKKELRAILDERGIKYEETDTNATLQKLIDDNPVEDSKESDTEEEEDQVEDTEEESEDKEESEESEDSEKEEDVYGPVSRKDSLSYNGKGNIDIINGDRYIRTFSEETHGKDFVKIAKNFINKNSNDKGESSFKMVNSSLIKKLSVTYEKIDKAGKASRVSDYFGESIKEKNRALIVASANCVDVKIDE